MRDEVVGGILLPAAQAATGTDPAEIAAAWAAVAPVLREMFLALQALASQIARDAPRTIIVALPVHAETGHGLADETLSAALLGLALSAASALAGTGIAVHAVHAPDDADDTAAFALLAAALMGDTVVTPGALLTASDGHVVSFVPEMPAWQHFGDAELTEAWLAAIAAAVTSRGRAWSSPARV
jgi:NAD(P)-dependent dehydrogenase (short-subunit alcohol dehydrogenase family)